MIELKYKSKQIGAMNAFELESWGMALLLKIHVITGWTIPAGDLLNILVDQFQKKLIESYPEMNVDEIEYAFRNKGTQVKDWGKAMNLSLIDDVLYPYLFERAELSHALEERKKQPSRLKINTDQELENFHRQWTEDFYQRIKSGQVEPIPAYSKAILVKDGLIENEFCASNFFVQKLNSGAKNIYKKAD